MQRVSKDKCLEIIDKFEPSKEGRLKGHLGIDGEFCELYLCSLFSLRHPNHYLLMYIRIFITSVIAAYLRDYVVARFEFYLLQFTFPIRPLLCGSISFAPGQEGCVVD